MDEHAAEGDDAVRRALADFPCPDDAPQVDAVVAALYDTGLIVAFEWPEWSERRRYFDGAPVENEVVAVKFLTAVVRAERFSEGTLAAAAPRP